MLELFVLFYFACAVLNYGLAFAYLQRKFELIAEEEYHKDRGFALLISVAGPLALIVTLLQCEFGRYGLKFR